MDTFNIYMDYITDGVVTEDEIDEETEYDVEFVVVSSEEDTRNEEDAILSSMDVIDLIRLRDAIQAELDNIVLAVFESTEDQDEELP